MAKKSEPKKKTAKKKGTSKKQRSTVIKQFAESTSEVIQKASTILEEEINAGVTAARAMEKSLREEKDFQSDELSDIIQRLRQDSHQIVDVVSNQVDQLRSKEFDELVQRFKKDAHDVVDIFLDLLKLTPERISKMNSSGNQEK